METMEITLDGAYLAKLKATAIDMTIHVKAELNVTAFTARQKVNVLMLNRVSTGLLAGSPELVISNGRLVWRVPVLLTLPGHGQMGQVGCVDVDVQNSQLFVDQPLLDSIANTAYDLAKRAGL